LCGIVVVTATCYRWARTAAVLRKGAALRDVAGCGEPLRALAGHTDDLVEVAVVVQEREPVQLGGCRDTQIDRAG
jgi:hypothetical protein